MEPVLELPDPKFRADGDRLLIFPDPPEEMTKAGIHIPAKFVAQVLSGRVAAAGPDSKKQRGDRVVYGNLAGTELKLHGVEYKIMRRDDVFGVVE